MPALMEREESAIEIATAPDLDRFFKAVSAANQCALAMDFDGTLAPFRIDPLKARPWSGVVSLLERIQLEGRTRLAIISGRPALQVKSQLSLKITPEIWGLHGSEHLDTQGQLELEDLLPDQQDTLNAAKDAVQRARLGVRREEKRNAVVLHWRGRSPRSAEVVRQRALAVLQPFAVSTNMSLLHFDGGFELRAGRNKGDAVRELLQGLPTAAPIAYLGDDTTDEDAFRALAGRGLSVLVRREWRQGAAQLWLRPPVELRGFLERWLDAVSPSTRRT